jgi:hypothetical protein
MAELHDPTLARTQPDYSRNLVGDRGPEASTYASRDGCDGLRSTAKILSARYKHRVEEDGSIVMAPLEGEQRRCMPLIFRVTKAD